MLIIVKVARYILTNGGDGFFSIDIIYSNNNEDILSKHSLDYLCLYDGIIEIE